MSEEINLNSLFEPSKGEMGLKKAIRKIKELDMLVEPYGINEGNIKKIHSENWTDQNIQEVSNELGINVQKSNKNSREAIKILAILASEMGENEIIKKHSADLNSAFKRKGLL